MTRVELKPSLKAALAPLAGVTLAGLVAALLPFYLPYNYSYTAELAIAILILILTKGRAVAIVLPFLVASSCYFNKYLALTAILVSLIEDLVIIRLFKSTKVIISDNEITVRKDYIIKSSIKTIPKSSIAEISITQGISEKIMGFSDIIIILRNGDKVKVEGVKKEMAEKALELIRSK